MPRTNAQTVYTVFIHQVHISALILYTLLRKIPHVPASRSYGFPDFQKKVLLLW